MENSYLRKFGINCFCEEFSKFKYDRANKLICEFSEDNPFPSETDFENFVSWPLATEAVFYLNNKFNNGSSIAAFTRNNKNIKILTLEGFGIRKVHRYAFANLSPDIDTFVLKNTRINHIGNQLFGKSNANLEIFVLENTNARYIARTHFEALHNLKRLDIVKNMNINEINEKLFKWDKSKLEHVNLVGMSIEKICYPVFKGLLDNHKNLRIVSFADLTFTTSNVELSTKLTELVADNYCRYSENCPHEKFQDFDVLRQRVEMLKNITC